MDNWVKLSVRYYADEKIEALPDADTELMFVRSLARAGEMRKGGFIPESSLPLLSRRRRYAASVDALIASGLWTKVDGGYRVTNWSDWQDALDGLEKRRTTDRDRKRASRAAEREALVLRFGNKCRRCGSTENLVKDHIIPLSRGGKDIDENKQLLCWSCNARKRNLTEEEYDQWLTAMGEPAPNPTPTSKESAGVTLSADVSADVRRLELEGEEDLKGSSKRSTHVARVEEPPPPKCPEHLNDPNPPACGHCAEARKRHNQWQTERAQRIRDAPKCRHHRGELAHNCRPCRSEQLAAA